MAIFKLHIFLLVCIGFVVLINASAEKDKGKGSKENKEAEPTAQPRSNFFLKKARKMFVNLGDKVKAAANKHLVRYRKSGTKKSHGANRVSISHDGLTIYIGEEDKAPPIGEGHTALCVEVFDESREPKIREIETTIVDKEKKDVSSDFKLMKLRLWSCIDKVTADHFFEVEREYIGEEEVRQAYAYPNVKAWSVELEPGEVSDVRKTVQFTERKFLDKDGKRIDYVGDISHHTPDRKRWNFNKKNKKEQDGDNKKTGGDEGGKRRKKRGHK